MNHISVLIADDQDLVREGLRMLLEAEPDITVAGEAGNSREAIAAARRLDAGQLYLSEATVKSHVARILAKLGLRDRGTDRRLRLRDRHHPARRIQPGTGREAVNRPAIFSARQLTVIAALHRRPGKLEPER